MLPLKNFWLGFSLVYCLSLSAWAQSPYAFPHVDQNFIKNPTFAAFSVCSNIGCEKESIKHVALNEAQKNQIKTLFQAVTHSALERDAVAQAMALFEVFVGSMPKVNTRFDIMGNTVPSPFSRNRSNQMDCIAESHTAASYLSVLQNEGLLRFHRLSTIVQRGTIFLMTQHYAPRIVDLTSSKVWSVDTWLLDNGFPAYVMPYDDWNSELDRNYTARTLALCRQPEICVKFSVQK